MRKAYKISLVDLKGRHHLEGIVADGRIKEILKRVCTGSVWLTIGTSSGLFWTRYWTFRFCKRWGM